MNFAWYWFLVKVIAYLLYSLICYYLKITNIRGILYIYTFLSALALEHCTSTIPLGTPAKSLSFLPGWQPLWQVLLLHTPWKIVALLPRKNPDPHAAQPPRGSALFGFSHINFISSLGNHRPDKRYPGRMFQFLFCFIYFCSVVRSIFIGRLSFWKWQGNPVWAWNGENWQHRFLFLGFHSTLPVGPLDFVVLHLGVCMLSLFFWFGLGCWFSFLILFVGFFFVVSASRRYFALHYFLLSL